MIQLNTLGDLQAHLPRRIHSPIASIIASTLDLPLKALGSDIELASVFDSPMFLIETMDDLASVQSFDLAASGRVSLLQAASPWFDVARWEADYAIFATVETANGGPQYFIPPHVASTAPHVGESINLKAQGD